MLLFLCWLSVLYYFILTIIQPFLQKIYLNEKY